MNRRRTSTHRARRMHGSINLSMMPNVRAELPVRSLSEGMLNVDDDIDDDSSHEQKNIDDSDSLRSLEHEIADSQPAIAHFNVTLHLGSSDGLTASMSTDINKPKNKKAISRKLSAKQRILERRKKSRARFTASAADTPIPTPCDNHSMSLASCLSSSSYSCNYENENENMMSCSSNTSNSGGLSRKRVNFSRVRVREYEVTCEDLTSSCPVIGLGWRYNPQEKVSRLDDDIEESDSDVSRGGGENTNIMVTTQKAMNDLKILEGGRYPELDDTKSKHWPDAAELEEGQDAATTTEIQSEFLKNDIKF